MATFTLQSPGKATASHDVALETAPVADLEHKAKSIPDTADYYCVYEIMAKRLTGHIFAASRWQTRLFDQVAAMLLLYLVLR